MIHGILQHFLAGDARRVYLEHETSGLALPYRNPLLRGETGLDSGLKIALQPMQRFETGRLLKDRCAAPSRI